MATNSSHSIPYGLLAENSLLTTCTPHDILTKNKQSAMCYI